MAKNIRWTAEEWDKVAKAWCTEKRNLSMRRKIAEVQMVLPEDRRRNITDGAGFIVKVQSIQTKVLETAFDNRAASVLGMGLPPMHKRYTAPQPAPVVVDSFSIETEQAIRALVQSETARYEQKLQQYVKQRVADMVSQRVDEIEQRQNAQINGLIEQEFATRMQGSEKKYGRYVEKAVTRKRAVIIGLLGAQATQVKQLMGDSMNVTFIESDVPIPQMRKTCQSADYVLMMRKFISHKCTNAINKNTHSGFFLIDGGMTELEEKLVSLV